MAWAPPVSAMPCMAGGGAPTIASPLPPSRTAWCTEGDTPSALTSLPLGYARGFAGAASWQAPFWQRASASTAGPLSHPGKSFCGAPAWVTLANHAGRSFMTPFFFRAKERPQGAPKPTAQPPLVTLQPPSVTATGAEDTLRQAVLWCSRHEWPEVHLKTAATPVVCVSVSPIRLYIENLSCCVSHRRCSLAFMASPLPFRYLSSRSYPSGRECLCNLTASVTTKERGLPKQ